jgi:hypothetical protein
MSLLGVPLGCQYAVLHGRMHSGSNWLQRDEEDDSVQRSVTDRKAGRGCCGNASCAAALLDGDRSRETMRMIALSQKTSVHMNGGAVAMLYTTHQGMHPGG